MRANLLKYRRHFFTFVAALALLYTASITVQLLSKLKTRAQCHSHKEGDSLRRMIRHSSSEQSDSSHDTGKLDYRLDMIKADIQAYDNGQDLDEEFDRIDDKTDYFGCAHLNKIPRTHREVEENLKGNRGITFLKVRIDGVTIPVVMKEANRRYVNKQHILFDQAYNNDSLYRAVVEQYKYNSAKREVMYLRKLRGLRGIPRLFGSCIEDIRIRYIVEKIDGYTLCNDNGTTKACALGDHVVDLLKQDPNPELAAVAFAYSTTIFFQQLEDRHLFMEDISGLNFMVSKRWQLFMVDADSLVFYNDSRIYAHVSCSSDDHCPVLSGNLWADISLNKKIYKECRDLSGICEEMECRGYGTELHTCGMAHWYICRIIKTFKYDENVEKLFTEACECMKKTYPHERCTFREASKLLREGLRKLLLSKGQSLIS